MTTQALNTAVNVADLDALVGHKIKFEFESEQPVTGVLEGTSGKIGMIVVGKEKEGILLNELTGYTDYGTVTGEKAAPVKKQSKPAKKEAPAKKTAPGKQKHAGEKTKRQLAEEIYDAMPGAARKEVIAQFIEELGMTQAGASTYYANVKKSRQ